ncbi:protein kinase domain-containing protein [Spirillospora sp. CA-294931]|uniref:serine/threonine-protein kinase n=1 Tax=Spirillospora sp. CA-294931 TaxID=3240042 RepID=UPI003D8FA5AF
MGEDRRAGAGRVLAGRYRLVSVVGRGGMGTVWRAHDEMLHRDVAVKEVQVEPGLSDDEREVRHLRTLREARASGRLNHPGVVTVHDVVDEDGRPWIVMELVQARSLQEVIEEDGTLPPARVAAIGRQMVGALRAAHAIGILHRDVKPANVLITGDDRAVLTDFGIASVEGDATLTHTGRIVGSPAYMSPERVNGDRALPASDLWALGATLYAACEGKPPYHRTDTVAVLAAIVTQEPPEPRNAGPLLPVLRGLLVKDPVARMDADQADALLAQVVAGQHTAHDLRSWGQVADPRVPTQTLNVPGPAMPPPPERRASSRRMLWPVLAGVLGVAVVALAIALALRGDDPKGKAAAAKTTPAARGTAPAPPKKSSRTTPETQAPVIPQGMTPVGNSGYQIPVPQGWTEQRKSADRTLWLDPRSDAYVFVDRTPWTGTPHAHWLQWEREVRANNRLPGYQRLDLTPVRHGGTEAADIEYAWNPGNTRMRAWVRGVIINGRQYAVMMAAPESQWNEWRGDVKNVLDGFRG